MKQRKQIWLLILQMYEENGKKNFTRKYFLNKFIKKLERKWPNQKTPSQTVSRIFQELRDDGKIEFLEKGVYRIKEN
tara:strand:- start:65 stop:295 length:231 start_codon:yes stop_codon:yes gene_type:complete